jgi:hypothetical protein
MGDNILAPNQFTSHIQNKGLLNLCDNFYWEYSTKVGVKRSGNSALGQTATIANFMAASH